MFGAMPRCPNANCEDNYLVYSAGKYKCTGKTEWVWHIILTNFKAHCTYTIDADKIEPSDWQVPDDTDSDFLASFEFKKHAKVIYSASADIQKLSEEQKKKAEEEAASQEAEKQAQQKKKDDDKRPFGSMIVAFAGRFSVKQKELQEMIENNGGACNNSVTRNVDILVSTQDEFDNETTKIEKAKYVN